MSHQIIPLSASVSMPKLPNLDSLPPETRDMVLDLILQNDALIQQVQASYDEKRISEQLRTKITELSAKITDQSLICQQNNELKIANEELTKLNNQMKQEIQELRDLVQTLKEENRRLQKIIESYEERITNLERRDKPITVREAMRILERFICLESAGSKNKFLTKFFNFDKITKSGDTTVVANFNNILNRLGLTTAHLEYLSNLKDNGDIATHDNRPRLSKAEWDAMQKDGDDEEDDEISISELWTGLINSLATYIPPPSDPFEPWVIEDPVNKSKTIITIPRSSTTTSTDSSTTSTPIPLRR